MHLFFLDNVSSFSQILTLISSQFGAFQGSRVKLGWFIWVSENIVPLFPKDYHVSYFFHIKITVWGYSKFQHTDFGVHSQKVITGKGIGSRQITVTNHGRSGWIKINWSNQRKSAQKPRFSMFIWGYVNLATPYFFLLQIRSCWVRWFLDCPSHPIPK